MSTSPYRIGFLLAAMFLVTVSDARAGLVLNEALANEIGSATSLEWVEVLNWPDTGNSVSIYGYRYLDGGDTTLVDTNITIPPGGFLILARRVTGASSFEESWGNNSGVWGDHPPESYPVIVMSKMSLRNSSDTVSLLSPDGIKSTILWTSDAGDGVSIERIRPGSNDDLSNFGHCRDSLGSTPGTANSLLPLRGDLKIDTIVTGPANPQAGQTIHFAARIANVGFGDARPSSLRLFRDRKPQPEGQDFEFISEATVGSISEAHDTSIVLDWAYAPPGIGHLILELSADADSSNNTQIVDVPVRFTEPSFIVSEFLANPEPGGPDEWVEIANVSDWPINVEGLRIGDSLNSELIPIQDHLLRVGEFWVLCENESAFRAFYPAFNGTLVAVPGWRALNNTGDAIRLYGPLGETIDSLTFREVYADNRSVERVELESSFASGSDWTVSVEHGGATPGRTNSVIRGQPGTLQLDSVWLDQSTPDGGQPIHVSAAVSNVGFGPADGWFVLLHHDLDLSVPGSQLELISELPIGFLGEGEAALIEGDWSDPPPGILRLAVTLRNADGAVGDTSGLTATVRFNQPLIIISEYLAASSASGPGEWIELYNASDLALSPNGLRLGDNTAAATIPPWPATLEPGSFTVMASDQNQFRSFYPSFDGDLLEVPNWRALGDNGDAIRLLGPLEEIIDSVTYGPVPLDNVSIERRQLIACFADPRDWGASVDPRGATPGDVNSIRRHALDLSLQGLEFDSALYWWGDPITGTIALSNSGFATIIRATVSVAMDDGEFPIATLAFAGVLAPGKSSSVPFALDGVYPGRHEIHFSLPDDEDNGNNSLVGQSIIGHTYPAIIVSEFLANPENPGPGEWVEIYNASHRFFSLDGMAIGDSTRLARLPSVSMPTLAPGEYAVLCENEALFMSWYPGFAGMAHQVETWQELNNSGDGIRLYGVAGEVVDSLSYRTVHGQNHSRERTRVAPDFSTSNDWTESVDPTGATPGRPNSASIATAGPFRLDIAGNPVYRSRGELAQISYTLQIGERLTVKVFDRDGRLVRTLINNQPSATGVLQWDGDSDDGEPLRPGPYVLLGRTEPSGSVTKKVIVLAP